MKTNKLTIYAKLCQNVMAFLPKTLPCLFQMQEKLETWWNSNFTNSRRSSFRDDVNVTYRNNKCLGF